MPDGQGKGDKSGPPAPSSANGKVGPFQPHVYVNKGDVVTAGGQGFWVCLRGHGTGLGFALKAGQSDDNWHYSVGAS